jgi:hypothetical protein
MTGLYVMLFGIVAFVGIVTLLDWLGRRQERRARDRAA